MSTPPITIHTLDLADLPEPPRAGNGSTQVHDTGAPDPAALQHAPTDRPRGAPDISTDRRRRGHRLTPWLGLAALLLPLLARAQWPEPYPQVPLAPLACPDSRAPLVVDIIDDRSSSTYANDPRHRREPELRQVIEWFDQANCHVDDAVSVQSFDDVLTPVGRTVLNDDGSLNRVLDALPDRAPESSSTLGPTTRRATSWASHQPATTNMLLVATDGELTDFQEAFGALEQYPGAVHILALGSDLPPEWKLAPSHRVTTLRFEARFGDIARAIADELQGVSRNRSGGEAADD
jgi:hypothetical protein